MYQYVSIVTEIFIQIQIYIDLTNVVTRIQSENNYSKPGRYL